MYQIFQRSKVKAELACSRHPYLLEFSRVRLVACPA